MCEVGTNCDKQDVNASLAFNILYIYLLYYINTAWIVVVQTYIYIYLLEGQDMINN